MQNLASFDRWVIRRSAHKPAAKATSRPNRNRSSKLISPDRLDVIELEQKYGALALLKVAHGIVEGDWCGLLADESYSSAARLHWRLALWRKNSGQSEPQWLSSGFPAPVGQSPASLYKQALRQALQELWAQGWRVVGAEAFS